MLMMGWRGGVGPDEDLEGGGAWVRALF